MYATTTCLHADGTAERRAHEVTSLRAAFGFHLAARCCSTKADGTKRMCLIAPPSWAWNIGVHGLTWRWSLGAVITRLGHWAHLHDLDPTGPGHRIVATEAVEPERLWTTYGWDEAVPRGLISGRD